MPGLLNYTTSIPVDKTVREMQEMLRLSGAMEVSLRYSDGRATGLTFTAPTQYGPQHFILPVDVEAVRLILVKNRPRGASPNSKPYSIEQAERVAWRVARSWLEAQLAMIQIGLAKIDQIMLPYMNVGGEQTVYDKYLESQQYLQIESGS